MERLSRSTHVVLKVLTIGQTLQETCQEPLRFLRQVFNILIRRSFPSARFELLVGNGEDVPAILILQ